MDINKVISALTEIESERMISKEIVVEALSEALVKAYRKQVEIPDALVRVAIDGDSGNLRLFHQKLIVEEVEDDELEMDIEEALEINKDYKLGDYYETEISVDELGRAAAILAKSVLKQKIREAEKQAVHDEYIGKLHEMVTGVVESVEEKFAVVNLGKTLAILPKVAQIPNERYYESQRLKVVITEVNKDSKGAQVLVSRADGDLVRRLFESEVPEIYEGIVEIKAVVRDPGERCKISVYSKRSDVDAIGACIGQRGQRVKVISEEILGEKIDIFEWSDNITELIKNSFAPANVLGIYENADGRGLVVVVEDNQLSLAIGRKGKNARLAVKLTNQKIDIKTLSDVESLGIDWKMESLGYLAKVEAELRKKELEKEEAEKKVEVVVETIDDDLAAQEELKAQEELARLKEEELAKQKADEEIEKKIKKAKKSLAERQTSYVSKLESLADNKPAATKPSEKPKRKSRDEEERKLRASELKKDKDLEYKVKPVYSAEELAEIEKQTNENQWEDDVDYDEFDQYYDFEE